MTARLIVVGDPDGAQDLASETGALTGDAAPVHLGHRHLLRRDRPGFLEASEVEVEQLALGDLRRHPRQLALRELKARDRLAEHDPLLAVPQSLVEDAL